MFKTIAIILGIIVLVIVAYFIVYAYVLSAFFERGTIEVGDVERVSGLVGKQFVVDVPLVYVKNLPYFKDVESDIVFDTPVVLTRKTSYDLKQFRNNCSSCLVADRLVTDIRVEFIPIGTVFTVIEEFLQITKKQRGRNETTHFLLVEDDKGKQAEISKLDFELYVLDTQGTRYPWGSESKTVAQSAVEHLSNSEVFQVEYCFRRRDALPSLVAFIDDFNLKDDMQLANHLSTTCSVITYNNLDAFMTAHYYFTAWGLDGDQVIQSE